MIALAGLALGVALGAIPVSWVVHRALSGGDLRDVGSGNPGATNAWRAGGPAAGGLSLVGDLAKGAAAVALARALMGGAAAAAAALGAPLGHAFSPWLRLRGGKGVAAAMGAFLVAAPLAALAALVTFGATLGATRWVSAGSVAGALALPIAVAATGGNRYVVAAAVATAILIVWRHRPNFARMRRGTEPRIGSGGSRRG